MSLEWANEVAKADGHGNESVLLFRVRSSRGTRERWTLTMEEEQPNEVGSQTKRTDNNN